MSVQVVQQVRVKYPTPLGAQHAAFLMELAQTLGGGAGLLRKEGGTIITLPDGVTVAQDIICYPNGRIFDCLGDGEGAAVPTWAEAEGSPVPVARYYKVTGSPAPTPQPPVPPPPSQPSITEPDAQRLAREADAAYRAGAGRPIHDELLTFLLFRYLREGYTATSLIAEAKARGVAEA